MATMGSPLGQPNPLLEQLRQQARQSMQPDTPPPALMPPPGMDTGAPPIQGTPQPTVKAPRGTITGEQAERNRLVGSPAGSGQVYGKITGSDFGQNHPIAGKLLGGLAQGASTIGDIALSGAAPHLASLVPGTTAHHNLLVNQEDKNINQMQGEQQKEAQTKNLELQPQLRLAQQALQNEKQNETETHHEQQIAQQLHAHGFKQDEQGNIVPLTYEEMDPQKQAVTDLKGSQEELAEANTALKKAANDPNSPQYRLAQQRLDSAKQARSVALRRLGLSEAIYDARYKGTDTSGEALPGAMLTDQDQPVGSSFSQNVRPTGTERNKGDMAISAHQQLTDIKDIVHKHPTLFGPGYGQTAAFRTWLGSQDPDAQRFVAARTIAGDHLAGTFGGRSEAALNALDKAIGSFKDNPKAMEAGLNQLLEANKVFEQKGRVRSVGSNSAKTPSDQTLGASETQAFTINGKTYNIPADKVAEFKKDHPDAR